MQEEEIAHWQAVIQTNSGDADAFVNLGVALYRQDKRRNREQAIGYVKQAIALYKAQGYEEEASQAHMTWGMMYWGYYLGDGDTVLKLEDGTYLKIEGGTNLKVVEHTPISLVLQDPKPQMPLGCLIGCLAPFLLLCSSVFFFVGLLIVRNSLEQLFTGQLQDPTSVILSLLFGILNIGVAVLPNISLVIYLSSSSTCTFDKILGSVIIKNKNLFRTKVIKCSLYEVVDVQIEEKIKVGENDRYQVYRVVLVLSSGKRLPLTPFPSDGGKHPHQIIDLLQRFISS
jgi:hypothetical protein